MSIFFLPSFFLPPVVWFALKIHSSRRSCQTCISLDLFLFVHWTFRRCSSDVSTQTHTPCFYGRKYSAASLHTRFPETLPTGFMSLETLRSQLEFQIKFCGFECLNVCCHIRRKKFRLSVRLSQWNVCVWVCVCVWVQRTYRAAIWLKPPGNIKLSTAETRNKHSQLCVCVCVCGGGRWQEVSSLLGTPASAQAEWS